MSRLSRLALTSSPRLLVIPALLAFGAMTIATPTPAAAQLAVGISVQAAPPPLIEYDQPPIPAPGYLWNPGYWAYGDAGYYWVPGTWAEPPAVGLLWTPPYWGFVGGAYVFNAGYWGATVGFYGGINYGFGFGGIGYEGGFWRGGVFSYNRAVNNFGGVHITNVYNKTVVNVRPGGAAFNGPGGVTRQATASELAAAHENHVAATAAQQQHLAAASHNEALRASVNHGHPAITATSRPGDFSRAGEAAHPAGAEARPEAAHPAAERSEAAHPAAERSEAAHPAASHPATHTTHTAKHHVAPSHPAAPHAAAPHPAPHAMAPHPMAPRPAAPHPAAPHPAPHPAAPPPKHH
jgi:hypothetical protein